MDVVTDSVVHLTSDGSKCGPIWANAVVNWLLFENCELSVSRPSINLQSHGKAICVPAALQAVKQAAKQAVKPSGHNLHPQSIVLKDQEARHGTRPSLLIFHGLRDESVQPQKRTHHTCIPRRNTSTMCNSESSITQVQDCRQIVNQPIHLQAADFAQSGLFFCFSLRFVPDIRCQSCS